MNFIATVEDEFERIQNELQYMMLTEEQENRLISSLEVALMQGHQSADETFARFEDIISELNSLILAVADWSNRC